MPFEGIPTLPYVIFWSGDICIYVRDEDIIRDGAPYKRIYMIPTEQVVWRYRIDINKLDYQMSEYGIIIKEYPKAYVKWLSQSPENQIVFIFCHFDGTVAFGNEIVDLRNTVASLEQLNLTNLSENTKLRQQYKIAIEHIKALERKKVEE